MQTANDTDQFPRVKPSPYDTWVKPSTHEHPASVVTTPAPAEPSSGQRLSIPVPNRRFARPLRSEVWGWAIVLGIWIPVVAVLLLGSLFAAIVWQSRSDQTRPVDAIVVLGAAQYDGRPTPVLQARLDHALELYRQGVAPIIVVTGGRQEGDRFTEAEASRDFLVSSGVPERAIFLENEGRDSWQSMEGASVILDEQGAKRILLVSDGFHLLRLKVMARHLGFTPFGSAATGSPIEQGSRTEFDYIIREGGGIIAFFWQHEL